MIRLIARAGLTTSLGRDYRSGDVFDLADDEARLLLAQGVAEVVARPDLAAPGDRRQKTRGEQER